VAESKTARRWNAGGLRAAVTHMLRMESPALAVDLLPEVGGKIGQIRDKFSGRDLLVPPQKPYCTIALHGDWLQGDTSGMDDCFPNIAAGPYPCVPWDAVQLPDLGEWTHGQWDVVESSEHRAVLERDGIALPYHARKMVCFVDDRTLELSYRVENRGDVALRYMWSAHPLIAAPAEYELRLPPGDMTFRTFPSDGKLHTWPRFEALNLVRDWIPRGTNLKIFVTGLTAGWCELRLPGHTLRFTFDPGATPVVGVWFNNFGFPEDSPTPFRCVAVEPCTSQSDLLDKLPAEAYPHIEAGGSAEWSFRLQVEAQRSTEA